MSTQESFNRLEKNVKDIAGKNRSRLTRNIVIQIILILFVIIYMSWAHSRIAQVDADVLVSKLQQKALQNLPTLSDQLADRLNAYAPELLEKLKQKILDMIPQLTKNVKVDIEKSFQDISKGVKEQLATIDEIIKAEKASLDAKMGQAPDKDKVDMLYKNVRAELHKKVIESTQAIKGDYTKMLKDITGQLDHLTLPDDQLKEDEVMQKRLIEIWVKLIKMNTHGDLLK